MRFRFLTHSSKHPIELMRLFDIPIKLDVSWLPMVVLHTWLVSQFWFASGLGNAFSNGFYFALGAVVTVFFFASILVHELAHALVARLEGIQIYDIQLHIFGGWARLIGEPRTALTELRIAIAGPASSFLLAVFFWLCLLTTDTLGSRRNPLTLAIINAFLYLAVANLTLAMFNLLPGLPLDGGRALRAWLWHRRKDVLSATKTAKQGGTIIAYMLMSYGIFLIVSGIWRGTLWQNVLSAVWLLAVGVFLMNAAENEYRFRLQQQEAATSNNAAFENTVEAIMRKQIVSLKPELTVSEFIDRVLTQHRQTSLPVAHNGRLHGILALEKLRAVPKEQWERLAIRDVMLPVEEAHFVTLHTTIEYAARKIKTSQLGHLAVIDREGLLVGSVTAEDLRKAA
jgi:Zn-dependent protease/predicted transcriptional regulator